MYTYASRWHPKPAVCALPNPGKTRTLYSRLVRARLTHHGGLSSWWRRRPRVLRRLAAAILPALSSSARGASRCVQSLRVRCWQWEMLWAAPAAARPWARGGLLYGASHRSHASRAPRVRGTPLPPHRIPRFGRGHRGVRLVSRGWGAQAPRCEGDAGAADGPAGSDDARSRLAQSRTKALQEARRAASVQVRVSVGAVCRVYGDEQLWLLGLVRLGFPGALEGNVHRAYLL